MGERPVFYSRVTGSAWVVGKKTIESEFAKHGWGGVG